MDLLREDVTSVVDQMVGELLIAARVEAPPVDTIALAQKHLGMVVVLDQRQTERGRARRALGQKQIYLRPEPTEERHQWTVAQQIGEHLKAELLQRLNVQPSEAKAMVGESLANLFAHRLLVPTLWFAGLARDCEYDLLALKQHFRTASHEVIAWRFLDLGESCIVTIIDNEAISRRRSNAWPTRRELSPAEARCQRYVHAKSLPRLVQTSTWTVQGWPVHSLGWKREILRSRREEPVD